MKNVKLLSRTLAVILCALMLLSVIPTSVFAEISNYNKDYQSSTHTVFKHTEQTLAPGITEYTNYAYTTADGKQMVYYVTTAEVSREDVVVQTAYKDQYDNAQMGMEKLTNIMSYANAKYSNSADDDFISQYYTAVAGVNASFYNMQTGQPLGVTYIDGVSFGTEDYDNFFAILADGTAVIDYRTNVGNYTGDKAIMQAVAGSQWLVRDGQDVAGAATDRASRTMVGITADGKVVTVVLDGRQEPFSCGGTLHECAQIMLEAGCVAAINLDGGGSTTYAAKTEGADNVTVVNRPSDGSERSISSGLIIASTAAPSNVFDHVNMTVSDEYLTVGSALNVTVTGVSPAGTSAEIPSDVTYEVSNGTYADGILTATAVGDVVLTAKQGENTVGALTVHCVVPDTIAFSSESITVPYGKTAILEMVANYGLNTVVTNASNFTFTLDNAAAGTVSGLSLTACAENSEITGTTITASFVGSTLQASANLVFGKGSEVLWDFEDQDISEWSRQNKLNYNYILTPGEVSLSSKEDGGIVHSGNYALRFNGDFSVSTEGGYMSMMLGLTDNDVIDLKGATRFGMWIYFPYEAKSMNGRIFLREVTSRNEDGTIKTYDTKNNSSDATLDGTSNWNVGFITSFQESGWHYISFDLTNNDLGYCIAPDGALLDIYISDRDNTSFSYNHLDYKSLNQNVVIYIDDVTLDYSSVVDDREAPIFSGVNYADQAMSDVAALANDAVIGGNTTNNHFAFNAIVSENTAKSNATGLDDTTAKAYIDGQEVSCTYDNGKISIDDIVLLNGNHIVKFTICDKQGNYASIIRNFTVNASGNDSSTIRLKAHDETLDKILLGSLYYVDLVATNAEDVNTVVVDLDLNNISHWELDHMDVAEGFTATYVIIDEDDNIARVTITKTGANETTGELALVSMPIRTWELPCAVCDGGTSAKGKVANYAFFKAGSETWPIDISVTVKAGILNGVTTFAGDNVQVDTESYVWDNATKPAEYATWNGGHDHRASTKDLYAAGTTNHVDAVTLSDVAATCTTDGYTGRTYCEVCKSVVDWGTTISATGHTWTDVEGVLQCADCGEHFNGEYTDGKTYTDGVANAGWVEDSYYVEGIKLVGVQLIDGFYYDFGKDGICEGKTKYTGLFFDGEVYRYSQVGILAGGWFEIDGEWYYYDTDTLTSVANLNNGKVMYEFETNGKLISGKWYTNANGTRYYYGPSYYHGYFASGFLYLATIDGKQYNFDGAGYCTGKGIVALKQSTSVPPTLYQFAEDSSLIGIVEQDGIVTAENGDIYYVADGNAVYKGLCQDSTGNYYYISGNDYKAIKNCTSYIVYTNGLKPKGTYTFGADGRMSLKNGVVKDSDGEVRYYENDVPVYAGLVQDTDGSYYYISGNGNKAVKNCSKYISYTNGLLPAGTYTFDADGKLQLRNGVIHDQDGEIRYYVNNNAVYAGLVQDTEGNYYYISGNGNKAIKNCSKYITYTNGLLSAGTYTFGADGKMIVD